MKNAFVCYIMTKIHLLENFLDKDISVSIHPKIIRSLEIKMYKVRSGISPEILNDLFSLRQTDQYNLRNRSQFIIPNMKTINHVNHGFESVKYLGSKLWETTSPHLKEVDSLKNF